LNKDVNIDIKMKAAISAVIEAYLAQIKPVSKRQLKKLNEWKLFTESDYNQLRISKINPWKNHTGFYN
tara:strand:- start:554 stop:757 length:204 start_codon:yes stop_codon:yes gene_type:complete